MYNTINQMGNCMEQTRQRKAHVNGYMSARSPCLPKMQKRRFADISKPPLVSATSATRASQLREPKLKTA